jgi:hypothetical protein
VPVRFEPHPQNRKNGAMFINIGSIANRTSFVSSDTLYIAMTRFNVRTPGGAEIRAQGAFAEWTARRVEIFQRYCLTPMVKQRIKPHAWVILFDEDVTPPIAALLERLREHPWIVPLLLGDDWATRYAAETRKFLKNRFGDGDYELICCTRLDSDDSLNTRFHTAVDAAVTLLRDAWTSDASFCVNFPFGAMQHGDSLMIYIKEKHFFALVEPFGSFRGPYRFNHRKVDQYVPVVDVLTERPMFIYHGHDQNITGPFKRVSLDEFADRQRVLRHFALGESSIATTEKPSANPSS